jgi:hypothetical protein
MPRELLRRLLEASGNDRGLTDGFEREHARGVDLHELLRLLHGLDGAIPERSRTARYKRSLATRDNVVIPNFLLWARRLRAFCEDGLGEDQFALFPLGVHERIASHVDALVREVEGMKAEAFRPPPGRKGLTSAKVRFGARLQQIGVSRDFVRELLARFPSRR